MALRAGYYGVKRWLWDKLQSIPDKVDGLIENINITGVKNFLIPLTSTYDNNGIVISPVSNGIKINGTTTAEVNYDYIPAGSSLSNLRGKFKLSLGVDSISGMNLVFYKSTSGSWNLSGNAKEIEVNLTDAEHLSGKVRIYIANAKTYSNVVISPMITLLSDPDESYEPYAMTNQELTKNITISDGLSAVTAATGATLSTSDSYIKRQGSLVSMMLRVNSVTVSGSSAIVTIPDGYRPPVTMPVFVSNASTGEYIPAFCTTSGLICPRSSVSSLNVNIEATWYTSSATLNRSLDAAPEERSLDVEVEEPVVVKKTTRKKTTKTEEEE